MVCGSVITIFWTQIPMNRMYGQPAIRIRLEKRYVTLGEHDDDLGEYKIVEGLTKKDAIAFPTAALEEGEKTEIGDLAQTMSGGADGITDMDADHGNMDDEQTRFRRWGQRYTDPDMEEGSVDAADDSSDDYD